MRIRPFNQPAPRIDLLDAIEPDDAKLLLE
jgi:hypothetical protein